jgi:HEAT repeat protein
MSSLSAHRFLQLCRLYAAGLLLCFCALSLVRLVYGQGAGLNQLIDSLKSPDAGVRWNAASALGDIKDPRAVASLIAALKDGDWRVRKVASEGLSKIGALAVEPLIAALKDQDPLVRRAAIKALGEINDPRGVEPLIAALKDSSDEARQLAASALGDSRDPRAVEPLIAALKDANAWVRLDAASSLGEIKDPRAVEPLKAALNDTDQSVRNYAAQALDRIYAPAPPAAQSAPPQIAVAAVQPGPVRNDNAPAAQPTTASNSAIDDSVTKLIAKLKEKKPEPRGRTVDALVGIGAPAVEPLIAALKDPNPTVRENAVSALGRIADPRVIDPLVAAVRDSDTTIGWSAGTALRKFNDPRTVEPLLVDMKDPSPSIRAWATLALSESDDPRTVEPMIAALRDTFVGAQRFAAHSLSKIDDPRAATALIQALQRRDTEVVAGSYPFFIRWAVPNSEEMLVEALMDAGNKYMAQDFVNSGNTRLESAAHIWASLHGYQEEKAAGAGAVKWGSAQQ